MVGNHKPRWFHFAIPALAAAMAGWLGFQNEVAAVTAVGKPPVTFRSATRRLMTPKNDRDAIKRLEIIRQQIGRGEPTPHEKVECWKIVRTFSTPQVKAYLANLADLPPDNRKSADVYLEMMLFQHMARLDPDAAELEMKKEPFSKNKDLPYQLMFARIARDPEDAMRWLESSDSEASMKRIGARFIGGMLARQDPEAGLERAEKLGNDALGAALRSVARGMADNAESRKDFYALGEKYGRLKDWNQILLAIAVAAGEKDAGELLDSVKDTGLPPEQSSILRDHAVRMLMQTEPMKAMDWAAAPESGVAQERQISIFRGWASEHPAEAIEWASRNGRQDVIADSVKSEATWMISRNREHWNASGTQDPWVGSVVARYHAWRNNDPAGAESWASSMPTDIRNRLNGKTGDATK